MNTMRAVATIRIRTVTVCQTFIRTCFVACTSSWFALIERILNVSIKNEIVAAGRPKFQSIVVFWTLVSFQYMYHIRCGSLPMFLDVGWPTNWVSKRYHIGGNLAAECGRKICNWYQPADLRKTRNNREKLNKWKECAFRWSMESIRRALSSTIKTYERLAIERVTSINRESASNEIEIL